MDEHHFDTLTRSLTSVPSRRDVLRGLFGAGLGLSAARLPEVVAAKKKRKRKVKRNAFGCVAVGEFCQTADQCCSGICEGKKGKKTCRAHDTGGCQARVQDDGCAVTPVTDIRCTTSTGDPNGYCDTTTGNAGFCLQSGSCFPCRKDVECQAFCGPQAACIRCDSCSQTGGTACVTLGNAECTFP